MPARDRRDDDLELGRRLRAGDPTALASLSARWAGPILALATTYLGDRRLAEEAVQDTLVKAWRAASRFDPERPLGPWLYTIARRAAIGIARRERRHTNTTVIPDDHTTTPGEDDTLLSAAWEAWQVRCALRDLPHDERQIVHLAHYLGLTHTQIATRLGLPAGTVKTRLYRAHRRLAPLLAHLRPPTDHD